MGSAQPHLLYSDGSPTPLFSELCSLVFARLDPSRTGTISPEDFSSFLDLLGVPTQYNVWKRNLRPICGHSPESNADAEFRIFLDNFEVPYQLTARISRPPLKRSSTAGSSSTTSSGRSGASSSTSFSPLPSPGLSSIPDGFSSARRTSSATAAAVAAALPAKTPLLSAASFVSLTALECAQRPERGWSGLNRAMAHYRLAPAGFQQLPRESLPASPLETTTQRVAETAARARQRAEAFLAASAVRVQQRGGGHFSPAGYG